MGHVVDWFDLWAGRHAKRFQLADHDMIAEWVKPFGDIGVTENEAENASMFLLANNPPKFRSHHLAALLGRIKSIRFEVPIAPPQDRGTCATCFGSGFVPVPIRFDSGNDSWDGRYLGVVFCSCGLGAWKSEKFVVKKPSDKGDKRPLTLQEYESRVPDWKELMADRPRLLGEIQKRNRAMWKENDKRDRIQTRTKE